MGEILTKLGFEVSYVVAEGSNISFVKKLYYIKKVDIRENDRRERSKSVFNSFKDIKIENGFDVIINETPFFDFSNYYLYWRKFGFSNSIDVLHGNGMRAVVHKKPPLLNFPTLGVLNRNSYKKLQIMDGNLFTFRMGLKSQIKKKLKKVLKIILFSLEEFAKIRVSILP